MSSAIEELQRLRELAAMATPRPWYFDEEGCCYGDLTDFHGDTTNPPVIEPVTGHLVDIEQADADYIVAAANLVPAMVELALACFAEEERYARQGDNACPVCFKTDSRIDPGRKLHEDDCPLAALVRALEAGDGR
jgi:hypothetical protein